MNTAIQDNTDKLISGHPVDASPRLGPLVRVIAGSLVTGMLAAVCLTSIVFAGAPEHVITGTALIGFAAGWAMLAVLSARMTSQPQRWARVPAAVMFATGSVLLVTAPGDAALTAAGWAWPPAALVLAIWCERHARHSLHTKARFWLVYPAIGAISVCAFGGAYGTVQQHLDRNAYEMPGQSYDIGGRTLHLNCTGTDAPTVVLQSGLGTMSPIWTRVITGTSETARVCSYDRAGQGWSDDAPHAQDGLDIATDLHTLLDVAGEHGPYVMVGHSSGGTYAMTYAAQFPEDVAGMVLLDSSSPHQFTTVPDFEQQYAMARSLYGVLPSVARLGIARMMPTSFFSTLPSPAAEQVRAFASSPRGARNSRDEQSQLRAAFTQAQALTTLNGRPLVVLTASDELSTSGWSAAQDQLATLSTNSSHRIADSTHAGLLDGESASAEVVDAIHDVVRSVRTGTPVSAG